MKDVGGCKLDMCKKVSWEEVVEVLNCLRRRRAPGLDGICMVVELMLQVIWC